MIAIIVVAAIVRLYGFPSYSYTNDELSAITRTDFSSLGEMIQYGVKEGDLHPPGVQVFMYVWTGIVGESELMVRLPFILMGIFALLFIYRLAKEQFNATTALMATAFMAVTQFFIFHGLVARPYAPVLLFSATMVYYWVRVIFPKGEVKMADLLIMTVSAIALCYVHHFGLFFAVIVGATGLILVKKKALWYIGAGVVVFLAYLPILNITLYQLKFGELANWLPVSDRHFLVDFFAYSLNYSLLFVVVAFGVVIASYLRSMVSNVQQKKLRVIFVVWFLAMYVVAHLYSNLVTSILQPSMLLSAFSFLVIFLFSWMDEWQQRFKTLFVTALLLFGTVSLFANREHFFLMNDQGSDKAGALITKSIEEGSDVLVYANLNREEYLTRYMKEQDTDRIVSAKYDTISFKAFRNLLETQPSDEIVLMWHSKEPQQEYLQILQRVYPFLVDYAYGHSFEYFRFSKTKKPVLAFDSFVSHEGVLENEFWDEVKDSLWHYGNPSSRTYKVFKTVEFVPVYRYNVADIPFKDHVILEASIGGVKMENRKSPTFVMTIENRLGQVTYYRSVSFDEYVNGAKNWQEIFLGTHLSKQHFRNGAHVLKVYLWNKDGQEFHFNNFKIKLRKGNPYIYGLVDRIQDDELGIKEVAGTAE